MKSMRRHGPKALGLAMLTATLALALAATSAQALPEYYLEGGLLAGTATVGSENETGVPFRLLVPGLGISIRCNSETDSGKIENVGGVGISKEGTMFFSECRIFALNEKSGKEEGELKTCEAAPFEIKFRDRLITHEGSIYDLILPEGESEELGSEKIGGALCPLGEEEFAISGSTAAQYSAGAAINQRLTFSKPIDQLICSNPPLGLHLCGLAFGLWPAYPDGISVEFLTGGNLNKNWEIK